MLGLSAGVAQPQEERKNEDPSREFWPEIDVYLNRNAVAPFLHVLGDEAGRP